MFSSARLEGARSAHLAQALGFLVDNNFHICVGTYETLLLEGDC